MCRVQQRAFSLILCWPLLYEVRYRITRGPTRPRPHAPIWARPHAPTAPLVDWQAADVRINISMEISRAAAAPTPPGRLECKALSARLCLR